MGVLRVREQSESDGVLLGVYGGCFRASLGLFWGFCNY